jgi:hypothetical protein
LCQIFPTQCTALSNDSFTLENTVSIYPNPTSNELTIVSATNAIETIKISNIFGSIVKEIKLNAAVKSTTVSVKELANGVYTIQLNAGKTISTLKFSKF